MSNNHKANPRY